MTVSCEPGGLDTEHLCSLRRIAATLHVLHCCRCSQDPASSLWLGDVDGTVDPDMLGFALKIPTSPEMSHGVKAPLVSFD